MATRFYLPSSGAAAGSPAYDAGWEAAYSLVRYKAVTTKIASAMTQITNSTDGNADLQDIIFVQYISDPIAAQTISAQTIKFQMRQYEYASGANLYAAIGIRVLNGALSSVTGTVLAVTQDNTELAVSTLTNRQFTATSSAVSANAGDRIVIEIGYGGDPSPASQRHQGAISIGDDSGTDLGENNTDTAAYNPWVEFANTITFSTGSTYNKSANLTAASVTNDTAALSRSMELNANLLAGSQAPDIVALLKVIASATTLTANSATGDTVEMLNLIALAANLLAQSATQTAAPLDITNFFAATLLAISGSPDDLELGVLRELAAILTAVSTTSDVVEILSLVTLDAELLTNSQTPDNTNLVITRNVSAELLSESNTNVVDLNVSREFIAMLSSNSNTSIIDLLNTLLFSADLLAISDTHDHVGLNVSIEFQSLLMADSYTPDIELFRTLGMVAYILANSFVADTVNLETGSSKYRWSKFKGIEKTTFRGMR